MEGNNISTFASYKKLLICENKRTKSPTKLSIDSALKSICPICSIDFAKLTLLEQEIHINQCIDSQTNQNQNIDEFNPWNEKNSNDFLNNTKNSLGYECFICGKNLSQFHYLEQNQHINTCIDQFCLLDSSINLKKKNKRDNKESALLDDSLDYLKITECIFCKINISKLNLTLQIRHLRQCQKKFFAKTKVKIKNDQLTLTQCFFPKNLFSEIQDYEKQLNFNKNVKKQKNDSYTIPSHHRIATTNFLVDYFKTFQNSPFIYFLSHIHSDHLIGLKKNWNNGVIYCSKVTANLLTLKYGTHFSRLVHTVPLNTPILIDDYYVTLIDSNHAPGSVMFLFENRQHTESYLHCGDFRFDNSMLSHPSLLQIQGHLKILYLDTTYCRPKYQFPSQKEVLNYISFTTKQLLLEDQRTLILVGSYSIGKEKIVIAISTSCQCQIGVSTSKISFLNCTDLPSIFTTDKWKCPIRLVSMRDLSFQSMHDYLKEEYFYSRVVGFECTGWVGNSLSIVKHPYLPLIKYKVPYSEHSTFGELREFVKFLKPQSIVPTVYSSTAEATQYIKYFHDLVSDHNVS